MGDISNLAVIAVLASLVAGSATAIGGIPILIRKDFSHGSMDGMLGFSAGIMISASFFTLIFPGIELGDPWEVMFGIALGAIFIYALDKVLERYKVEKAFGIQESDEEKAKRGLLMAGAVTLHNFPEGFAVGIGFLAGLPEAPALAIAIALQNIPEGLAVAAPLRDAGASRLRSFLIAAASGLTEPLAAVLGVVFLGILTQMMPIAMGFAAGAMIYVVGDEIIPESHSHGYHDLATFGLMVGFILMIALETLIGG